MQYSLINKRSGFAVIKLLLIGIIVAIIGGTLIFVFVQKNSVSDSLNSNSVNTKTSTSAAPDGTTSSIMTLTNQDIVNEENSDLESDNATKQDINATNNDANNLSGAYDVNNL